MHLVHSIESILSRGTKIVSFTYNDKPRNVLIGAKEVEAQGSWGLQLNRALRIHRGNLYLVARVQNEGPTPTIKSFRLSKIRNFSLG